MNKPDQRDEAVERLLQASLRGKGVGGELVHGGGPVECPDGETLAAWADGGLSPGALASVESHLAACARCQAVLATLAPSTADASSPSVAWWRRGFGLGWLVPVAGAVAAIAIWIAVPDNKRPLSPSSTAIDRSAALERQEAPAATAPAASARVAEQNDPLEKKKLSPAKSDAPRVDALRPQLRESTPLPAPRRSTDQDDKRERDEALKTAPAAPASPVDSFTPDRANSAPAAAAQAAERARSAAAP